MKKGGLYDGVGSEWDEGEHPRNDEGEFTKKIGKADKKRRLSKRLQAYISIEVRTTYCPS